MRGPHQVCLVSTLNMLELFLEAHILGIMGLFKMGWVIRDSKQQYSNVHCETI